MNQFRRAEKALEKIREQNAVRHRMNKRLKEIPKEEQEVRKFLRSIIRDQD